tara:strand:- start:19627 stop:20649 length:1023 start_codon:yes stop_codon:yes gene_type:complete
MKMKILIIGNDGDSAIEYAYFKAFKKLNHNVDFFKIDHNIKNRIIAKFQNLFPIFHNLFLRSKIISYLKNNNKTYDFIFIFKGTYLDTKTFQKIKNLKKTTWINYFPDDPFNVIDPSISNKNFLSVMSEFDILCIWSQKIKKKIEKKCKKNLIIYLPFAYDNLNNFKIKRTNKRKYLLTFFGTYDIRREKIINSIKYNKIVYGGNWNRLNVFKKHNFVTKTHIKGKKLLEVINSSKISLNILRKQNLTSHNMKTFEIPGCNGLMLTQRSKEQNDFFKENISCFMYANKFELNNRIKFILSNPNIANKVRKSGFKIAKKHTYINRTKYLIKRINGISRKKL